MGCNILSQDVPRHSEGFTIFAGILSGTLYIVPTPIGNLGDITYRAIEVLSQVDAILAEDTRQTKKLLNHYQVEKKLIPYHQHNEHKNLQMVIDKLTAGETSYETYFRFGRGNCHDSMLE